MVDRAIYIGANGAIAQQFGIDVLSNNIANINSVGYRSQRPTFSDLFNRTDRVATESTNPQRSGHGSNLRSIDTLFRQGAVRPSETFSDLSIYGDGFFVMKDARLPAARQTFYTRAGNFVFDAGITTAGSGNPFTSSGQTLYLRDVPEFTTFPRLVEPATGRSVQGYMADDNGTLSTGVVADIAINPGIKDPARETSVFTVLGAIDSDNPEYQMTKMTDKTNALLATLTGSYKNNQDRGLLSVSWSADGSGSYTFLKQGQTVPDPGNFETFAAGTVKTNSTHTFIPGVLFRTHDAEVTAGSFTALVGPYDVQSNSSGISTVEGVYLGNRSDGTLSVKTASTGAISWTFTPNGKNYVSESGSGTFATADSAISNLIPGVTLKKAAGTALTSGSLVVKTRQEQDTAGAVSPFYDDDTPDTEHTLVVSMKQIRPNEYGMMVSGQTTETYSDSAIGNLSNGQKRIQAYANIDPNEIVLRRVADNAELHQAGSVLKTDTGSNFDPISIRGSYWSSSSDLSGTVAMTVDAAGGGSWTFTPVGQTAFTAQGTIASGTLRPNTTYSIVNGNEVIPGLVFTTGSAISAGTATFESTIGNYTTHDNSIIFAPSFSSKITSLTSFIGEYKFASNTFTNSQVTTGTNQYQGNLTFDEKGQFLAAGSSAPVITFTPNSTLSAMEVTPTVTNVQQVFGHSSVAVIDYDGNLEGFLQQLQFNDQGKLTGAFSNKKERLLAQLVIANFRNPQGLSRVEESSFQQTVASGEATVGSIDQLPAGQARILPKSLEYSNSRLEDELTDLIFFQRAFQFSGRAIRAADELVQSAINLKR